MLTTVQVLGADGRLYQFVVVARPMTDLGPIFSRTTLLEISPRYVIVNKCGEHIQVQQSGGWHGVCVGAGACVRHHYVSNTPVHILPTRTQARARLCAPPIPAPTRSPHCNCSLCAAGLWSRRGVSMPIEKTTPMNLRPREHEAFHWPAGSSPHTAICVRYAGCAWSGAVSLEAEGDSSVLLRASAGETRCSLCAARAVL
jgi:hypothetical protein